MTIKATLYPKLFIPSTQVTNMGTELQSQNRVDVDYEKTTGSIYLKF